MGTGTKAFLGLIMFGLVLSVVGCDRGESARCALQGQILREGSLDSEGIQVFLPGTTYQALTDMDGRFRMALMEPGSYTLVAKDTGFVSIRESGITLKPGEELTLAPRTLHRAASTSDAGTVEGVFTLQGLEDHSGVLVALDNNAYSTLTDEYGRFVLPDIPQGDHKLSASKPGFEGVDQIPVTIFMGEKTILSPIELVRYEEASPLTGSFKGLVVDALGVPIPNVLVALPKVSKFTLTDSEGRYAFNQVPAAAVSILFMHSDYVSDSIENFEVFPGMTAEAPSVTLRQVRGASAGQATGAISGTVTLQGETDFSGIQVVVEGETAVAFTNADGRFLLTQLVPGYYDLVATRQGFAAGYVLGIEVLLDETTQAPPLQLERDLDLEPEEDARFGDISGRALLEGQPDHSGVIVALTGTSLFAMTNRDGLYQFADVTPGVYEVVASREGFLTASLAGIRVPPGGIVNVPDIRLDSSEEAPRVEFTNPDDGARGVAVADALEIFVRFSDFMDGGSVKNAVQIKPAVTSEIYFGGESRQSDNDLLFIRLVRRGASQPVTFDTEYTVTIGQSAANRKGVTMEEPYEFRFRTGGARIISVYPQDGATGVFVDEDRFVTIVFNAEIEPKSLQKALRVRPQPRSIPMVHPDFSRWGDRFRIEMELDFDKDYTVTVDDRVKTIFGERVENTPYRFSFRTVDINRIRTFEDALDRDERYIRRRDRR